MIKVEDKLRLAPREAHFSRMREVASLRRAPEERSVRQNVSIAISVKVIDMEVTSGGAERRRPARVDEAPLEGEHMRGAGGAAGDNRDKEEAETIFELISHREDCADPLELFWERERDPCIKASLGAPEEDLYALISSSAGDEV